MKYQSQFIIDFIKIFKKSGFFHKSYKNEKKNNANEIMHFKKIIMQYCINALLKNNNEIMQYYIISNDIALIMHCHALLQMPDWDPWKYFKVTLE